MQWYWKVEVVKYPNVVRRGNSGWGLLLWGLVAGSAMTSILHVGSQHEIMVYQ